MRKIILLLVLYLLSSKALWAIEFDIQAERALWRYQESAKDVTGFATVLPSRAQGSGALLKLKLSTERDQQWFFALSAAQLSPLSPAEENWAASQTNELKIKQQDMRMDLQYRMLGARFGLWLSKRQQTQSRQHFYINQVATVVAGEPISEVIKSDWAGLSLTSVGGHQGQFEASIDAALALNVEVTNPLFAQPFTRKNGYRTGAHVRWTLPEHEVGVSGLNLTFRYEYQELGGENTLTNGFWPYNRWQMATIGLLYAW